MVPSIKYSCLWLNFLLTYIFVWSMRTIALTPQKRSPTKDAARPTRSARIRLPDDTSITVAISTAPITAAIDYDCCCAVKLSRLHPWKQCAPIKYNAVLKRVAYSHRASMKTRGCDSRVFVRRREQSDDSDIRLKVSNNSYKVDGIVFLVYFWITLPDGCFVSNSPLYIWMWPNPLSLSYAQNTV